MSTFIELCVSGEIENPLEEIDEWIEFWHNESGDFVVQPLEKYLGMTLEEYGTWMLKPKYLLEIIEKRKKP